MQQKKNKKHIPVNSREILHRSRDLISGIDAHIRLARVATNFIEFDVAIETKNVDAIVEKSLRRAGLWEEVKDRLQDSALNLSGGQQQRVAIARMLMQRPELVLADEPDASLDPQSGEDVMRLLSDLARQDGLTLIIISHRLEHTLAFSDRIIGLSGGVITLDVATSQADPAMLRRFFDKPTE